MNIVAVVCKTKSQWRKFQNDLIDELVVQGKKYKAVSQSVVVLDDDETKFIYVKYGDDISFADGEIHLEGNDEERSSGV